MMTSPSGVSILNLENHSVIWADHRLGQGDHPFFEIGSGQRSHGHGIWLSNDRSIGGYERKSALGRGRPCSVTPNNNIVGETRRHDQLFLIL